MGRAFTQQQLHQENLAFAGTGGVSKNCPSLRPAFRDNATGRIELARFESGEPAPMHLLTGLPDDWVAQRDGSGHATALLDTIVAGFVGGPRFYTREEAAALSG